MTVAIVKEVIRRFLIHDKPQVLALKGSWGSGKTYAWKQLVDAYRKEVWPKKYCYVSLFGASSIAALRMSILTLTETKPASEKLSRGRELASAAKRIASQARNVLKDMPYAKYFIVGIDVITPHLITNTLICLDDFERLSSNAIPSDQLLGFISELKEERGCKIALIFNEEQLDGKNEYKKYREKIVDIELQFAPTAEESVDLALPKDLPVSALVRQYSISLEVTNIRLLRKISEFAMQIYARVENLHPKVLAQAIQTIILLAWCSFEPNEHKPTLQYIESKSRFFLDVDTVRQSEPKSNKTWDALLERYGFSMFDTFDFSLQRAWNRGYFEESGFDEEAAALDLKSRATEGHDTFEMVWKKYFHNTFENNEEELVEAFSKVFKKFTIYISPEELDSTVILLRRLGRNDTADNIIVIYMDTRTNDHSLFDPRLSRIREIRDLKIKERFEARWKEVAPKTTLLDVIKHIAESNSWSNEHIEKLIGASEDDLYALFRTSCGEDLSSIVRTCIQFERMQTDDKRLPEIGTRARKALIRIGEESSLNKLRIQKFLV